MIHYFICHGHTSNYVSNFVRNKILSIDKYTINEYILFADKTVITSDEKGNLINGDKILAIIATHWKENNSL